MNRTMKWAVVLGVAAWMSMGTMQAQQGGNPAKASGLQTKTTAAKAVAQVGAKDAAGAKTGTQAASTKTVAQAQAAVLTM